MEAPYTDDDPGTYDLNFHSHALSMCAVLRPNFFLHSSSFLLAYTEALYMDECYGVAPHGFSHDGFSHSSSVYDGSAFDGLSPTYHGKPTLLPPREHPPLFGPYLPINPPVARPSIVPLPLHHG